MPKKNFYIFSSGELKRKQNTLFFANEDGTKTFFPVESTNAIFIFGEVSFNKKLLEFLSMQGILLHYFSHYGYYMGTFYPREHICSGYLTLKQAEHYLDSTKRLFIARKIVWGSVGNILRNLRYYYNRGRRLKRYINQIEKLSNLINETTSIDKLMGIEGNMREIYYLAFDEILQKDSFSFEKRTKRPPQNYLNALISFGNSVLYALILSEIYTTHLDPRIGFLHTTNYRRFSLNLDISEIFKPFIIDRIIFKVVLKNMIDEKDFFYELDAIILSDKGRKMFLTELEKRLQTTIKHRNLGRKVSYKQLIKLELYKIEKHLLGDKEYEPFIIWW